MDIILNDLIELYIKDITPKTGETISQVQSKGLRIKQTHDKIFRQLVTSIAEAEGQDGLSAYQLAVLHGFIGSEVEWLLSLKGVKGDKGDPGLSGASGGRIYNEIPLGLKDGINKTFTTSYNFIPISTRVYKNTLRLNLNTDYIESAANQINIICVLRSTDVLIVDFDVSIVLP